MCRGFKSVLAFTVQVNRSVDDKRTYWTTENTVCKQSVVPMAKHLISLLCCTAKRWSGAVTHAMLEPQLECIVGAGSTLCLLV